MKNLLLLCLVVLMAGCLKTRGRVAEDQEESVESQVAKLRQQKAQDEIQQQDFNNELRSLYGRLESLEAKANKPKDELRDSDGNVIKQATIRDLVDQMKIFEDSLTKLTARIEHLESKKVSKRSSKPIKKKNQTTWEKAEGIFSGKNWRKAILAYQDYRDRNPKGKNYALATYKIGVCFQELKMKTEAKAFYEEAIAKAPKSNAARKAKYRLNQIK